MRPEKQSLPVAIVRVAAVAASFCGAAACTRPADLAYDPPQDASAAAALPLIADVTVTDQRDVPPDYAGAVMGFDGKPLKRLQSSAPVADDVRSAFRDALAARGELAPPGAPPVSAPYALDVRLLQLNAEQNADRQASADVVVRVVERTTGREVYSARTYTEHRGDNFLAYDNVLLGSPAALAGVERAVLGAAVNETVDREGFRRALRDAG